MKNLSTRYIFVYGSLMQGFRNPWSAHLHNHSRFISKGSVQGLIYDIKGYPGLVESADPSHRVQGELYLMSSLSFLKDFDKYEECNMKYPQRSQFTRDIIDVKIYGGRTFQAWTYFYNRHLNEKMLISSGKYTRYFVR